MTEPPQNWADIGVVTHVMGAVACFILVALMSASWRGSVRAGLLLAAAFLTGAWGIVAAIYAGSSFSSWAGPYSVLELARTTSWILFLLALLYHPSTDGHSRSDAFKWACALAVLLALTVLGAIVAQSAAAPGNVIAVKSRLVGQMLLAILGLVLVEQVWRGTAPGQRASIQYLYLGIGGLMAYDVILYSIALLPRQADFGLWNGRGLVPAIIAPMLAISATRQEQWSLELFVSRTAAVYAATLVGSGFYLLLMAAIGYYIQVHGGSWGSAIQAVFFFGALLLLATVLFSARLRAQARVFLSKHFYSYKYDYRDEWLRFIRTLGSGNDGDARIGSIRALGQILDSPGGILWTLDECGEYRCSAQWHLTFEQPRVIPESDPLVGFLRKSGWVVDLAEFRRHPGRYSGLCIPEWLRAVPEAWLVVPLIHVDHLHGFVILEASVSRASVNWEDHDLLKTAGQQVSSYLALIDASAALSRARQFEAFNRLSAYVVHDLKNVSGQLALVVGNADRHKRNPAFVDDTINVVRAATGRIDHMLQDLRSGNVDDGSLIGVARIERVLSEAVGRRAAQEPVPDLLPLDEELRVAGDGERLTTIIEHLVQNAQEATPEFGQVTLSAHREEDYAVIEIADTGCGMDHDFIRDRLFEPFDSTKGSAGMGIGAYEAREFIHALGGDMDVHSELGQGSTFHLRVPLSALEDEQRQRPDSPASMGAQW